MHTRHPAPRPAHMLASSGPCSRHRRIAAEPDWREQAQFSNASLPPRHRLWLSDDGSLTARLSRLNRGAFGVQRLFQGWEVPLRSERRLLGLPQRQRALVREVALCLGSEPVVFARSIFPLSSLGGALGHLRRLHNRSLGAILFRYPHMQRSPFELASMPADSDYLDPALRRTGGHIWGRRSRFCIGANALMVSEVFLQPLLPWPTRQPVHRSQRGRVNAAILRSSR